VFCTYARYRARSSAAAVNSSRLRRIFPIPSLKFVSHLYDVTQRRTRRSCRISCIYPTCTRLSHTWSRAPATRTRIRCAPALRNDSTCRIAPDALPYIRFSIQPGFALMEASRRTRISASPYVDRAMNLISSSVPGSSFRARELDRGLNHGQNDVNRYSQPFSRKTGDFLARKFHAESNDGEIHRRREIHPAKQNCLLSIRYFTSAFP